LIVCQDTDAIDVSIQVGLFAVFVMEREETFLALPVTIVEVQVIQHNHVVVEQENVHRENHEDNE